MEECAHHGWRSSVHEKLVGAGPANRLRAYVHSSGGRFSCCPGRRKARGAEFPRWSGHGLCHRCGSEIREDEAVGESASLMQAKFRNSFARWFLGGRSFSSDITNRREAPSFRAVSSAQAVKDVSLTGHAFTR